MLNDKREYLIAQQKKNKMMREEFFFFGLIIYTHRCILHNTYTIPAQLKNKNLIDLHL